MSFLQKCWHAFVPYYVRKRLFYYNHLGGSKHARELRQQALELGKKDKIKVLFIACNLPMWRGQGLYELLLKDKRFDARVIITPFERNSPEEAKTRTNELKAYFISRGLEAPMAVIDEGFDLKQWFEEFNPDILFPCQHYEQVYGNELDLKWNMHRLQMYIPYGTPTMKTQFAYNSLFHNLFLRVYHSTPLHMKSAGRIMCNNAENVSIVGEPDFDKFREATTDPWKSFDDSNKRKRLIWAPHFTLQYGYIHRAGFLWLCDEMVKMAEEYADTVQIAFKPHPHLYSILCLPDMWGKEKTDEYYGQWASMPNTQLETGDFASLFRFSDAMIHDCGSFTGEYIFTKKPVMFASKDIKEIRNEADDYGAKCLDLHYIGRSVEAVRNFIEEVVLKGNDPKKKDREDFYNHYLLPPHGCSVGENIYNDVLKTLGLKRID